MATGAGFKWYWVGNGGNDNWNNYLNWRYDPGNGTRVLGSTTRYPGSSYTVYPYDSAFIEQDATINIPISGIQFKDLTIGQGPSAQTILVKINILSRYGFALTGNFTVLSNVDPASTIRDDFFSSGGYSNTKNATYDGIKFVTDYTYASPVLTTHNISAGRIVLKTKVAISSGSSSYPCIINLLENLTLDCYSTMEFTAYFSINLNGYGLSMGKFYWNVTAYGTAVINFTPRADNYLTGQNNLSYIRITGVDGGTPGIYYAGFSSTYRRTMHIYSDGSYVGNASNVKVSGSVPSKYQSIYAIGQRPILIFDCDPILKNDGYSYKRTVTGFIPVVFLTSSPIKPQGNIPTRAQDAVFDYYFIDGQTGATSFTYLYDNYIYGTVDFTGNVPGDNTPKNLGGCQHPMALDNSYGNGYVFLGHFKLSDYQTILLGYYDYSTSTSRYDYAAYTYTSMPEVLRTEERGPNLWFMHDKPAKIVIDSANSSVVLQQGEIGYLYNTNTIKIGGTASDVGYSVLYSSQSISNGNGSLSHSYASSVLTFNMNGGFVNNQTINLNYNITVASGTTVNYVVTYTVSSEAGYDAGTVTIGSTSVVAAVSGSNSGTANGTLTAGTYSINIQYIKDGSTTGGSDTFSGFINFINANPAGNVWAVLSNATAKLAGQWTQQNPILGSNEVAWETDTGKLKKGNGSVRFNSLSYLGFTAVQPQNDYTGHSMYTTGLGDGWIMDFQSNSLTNNGPWDYVSTVNASYNQSLIFSSLAPNVKIYIVSDVCSNLIAINMYDNSCVLFIYNCVMWFIYEIQHVYGTVSTIYYGSIKSISATDQTYFSATNYDVVAYENRSTSLTYYTRTISYSMLGPGILDLYTPYSLEIIGWATVYNGNDLWSPAIFEVCNMNSSNYLSGGDGYNSSSVDGSNTYLKFGSYGISSSLPLCYSTYHQERIGTAAETIYKSSSSNPTIYFNFLADASYTQTGMIVTDTFRSSTVLDVYVYSLTGNLIDSTGYNINGNCFSIYYKGGWNGWYTTYSSASSNNTANTDRIKARVKTKSNFVSSHSTYFSSPRPYYSSWLWEDNVINILSRPAETVLDDYLKQTDTISVPLKLYQTIDDSPLIYAVSYLQLNNVNDLRFESGGPVTVEINNYNGFYNNYQFISANSQGKIYFNFTDIADQTNIYFINTNGTVNLAGLNLVVLISYFIFDYDSINFNLYGWNYARTQTAEYGYDPFSEFIFSDIESGHFISKNKNVNFRNLMSTLIMRGGQLRLPAFLNVLQQGNYFTTIDIRGGYNVINSNVVGRTLNLRAGVLDQTLVVDYSDNTGDIAPTFNFVDFTNNTYYRKFIHGFDSYIANAKLAFDISTNKVSGSLAFLAAGDRLSITTLNYSNNQFAPSLITFSSSYLDGSGGTIQVQPGNLNNLGSLVDTALPAVVTDTYYTFPPDQNALSFDFRKLPNASEIYIGANGSISTACVQTLLFGEYYNNTSWVGFGQNNGSSKVIKFNQDIIFCGNYVSPWYRETYDVPFSGGLVTPPSTQLEAANATTTVYFQGDGVINVSNSNLSSSIFPNINVGDSKYQYVIQGNQLGLPSLASNVNNYINYINRYYGVLSYIPETSNYTIVGGNYRNLNLLGGNILIDTSAYGTALAGAVTAVDVVIKDTIGIIPKRGVGQVSINYAAALKINQSLLTYKRYTTSTEILSGQGTLFFADGTTFNANLGTYGTLGVGAHRTNMSVTPTITINPCGSDADGSPLVDQISTATFGDLTSLGEGPAVFKFRKSSTSTFIYFGYTDTKAPKDATNNWYGYTTTSSNTVLKSTEDGIPWYISVPRPHQGTFKDARYVTNMTIKDSVALNDYMWFMPGTVNSKFATLHGTPGRSFREGYYNGTYQKGAVLPYFNWDLGNNSGWVFHSLPSATMDQQFWPNVPYDFGSLDLVDFYHQSWGAVNYTTPGIYTWSVPDGIFSISITAIGGGGGGGQGSTFNTGGAGGNLAAINTLAVTPGQTFTITVGTGGNANTNGGNSIFVKTSDGTKILEAAGGQAGQSSISAPTILPASITSQDIQGDIFGYGGVMGILGTGLGSGQHTAGGGAGGYGGDPNNRRVETGWGGNGLSVGGETEFATQGPNGNTSTVGGGGGGYANNTVAYGGGGTGIFGQTTNGLGGTAASPQGGGGSGGTSATGKNGGLYGGGGAGSVTGAGKGGGGAVRITWPGYSSVPK